MKTLFYDVALLLKEQGKYIYKPHQFLGIDGDLICYIGETKPSYSFDKEICLSNHLMMPGLINCHGHSAMTLVRGAGSGLKLQDWLIKAIFPIENKMTPKDIEAGTLMAVLEMLESGTTTFVDMYDFPYAEAEVLAATGINADLCRVGIAFDRNEPIDKHTRFHQCVDFVDIFKGNKEGNEELKFETGQECLSNELKEAIKEGRIRSDFCLHSEYLTSPNFLRGIVKENERLNTVVQVHVSETENEVLECIKRNGVTPVKYFEANGLLDHKVMAAHCVYVTDDELDIMAKKNTTLVYNPCSNMKLGSGMAPVKKAIDKGVNVALGTDGCASNDNLDMFKEMHTAALLSNLEAKDPSAVKASEIIDMATVNGAKALDKHNVGEIKVGFKADLIALDMNKPHLSSWTDIASLLVYSAKSSDVVLTMVNGKILYDHGDFLTINKEKVFEDFKNAISHLN